MTVDPAKWVSEEAKAEWSVFDDWTIQTSFLNTVAGIEHYAQTNPSARFADDDRVRFAALSAVAAERNLIRFH